MPRLKLRCKSAETLRKAYTRKNGTKVRQKCVKKRTLANKTKPVKQKSTKPVKQKSTKPVKQKLTKPVKQKSTKPVKKKSTKPVKQKSTKPVKQKLTKIIKNKLIPVLKRGNLTKHGYTNVKSLGVRKRRQALTKAITEYGAKIVLSKLGAIKTLHKNKNSELSRHYLNNQVWLRKKFDKEFKSSYKNSTLYKSKK